MVKILQVNIGRARAEHDLVQAKAKKEGFDLVVISEPNIKLSEKAKCILDVRGDVAVQVINKKVGIKKQVAGMAYIIVDLGEWDLYACYISLNITKSPLWGSPVEDRRGQHLAEWIAGNNLIVMNDGSVTFQRGTAISHINVTIATHKLAKEIKGWKILDEQVYTHHKYITYEVGRKGKREIPKGRRKILNKEMFTQRLRYRMAKRVDHTVETLMQELKGAVRESTRYVGEERDGAPYWWNAIIDSKRIESISARRKKTRALGKSGVDDQSTMAAKTEWDEKRNDLKDEIKQKRNTGESCAMN